MKVTKQKNEVNTYDILIEDNDKIFKIFIGYNDDLHWQLINKNGKKELDEFYITKENMYVYNLFDELFQELDNISFYKVSEYELKQCSNQEEINELLNIKKQWNEELKEGEEYKSLYSDNVITWISDASFNENECNKVIIEKEEEIFKITFSLKEKMFFKNCIRFRNLNSRYKPFNLIFTNMFNRFQEYGTEYQQMYVEEYSYQKKIKL